jgi:carboxyl-terminal processing protease
LKLCTLFAIGLFLSGQALAEQPNWSPGPHEPFVTDIVSKLLDFHHYSDQEQTQEIADRWFEGYLSSLDPNRMYFLQSDIEDFRSKWQSTLNDTLGQPSGLIPPHEIYRRYAERVQERVTVIESLLDQDIDLTLDESWHPDRSDGPWAESPEDLDEIWRQRIKSEVLAGDLNKQVRENKIESLRKRYRRYQETILKNESADILEMWLSSLTRAYDPHSVYWKPATSDNFNIDISNSVEGIGAVLQTEDEFTVIREIVVGGPADQDKRLGEGDKIIAVAQAGEAPVDIIDMRLDKVVKQIRGKKGSVVRLTIIPAGSDMTQTEVVDLVRDRVLLSERDAEAQIHEVLADDGTVLNVGVINVPQFYFPYKEGEGQDVSDDMARILEDLSGKNVDGLILDLRENGGGGLGEAVDIAGMFFDSGPVVQVRDQAGTVQTLSDKSRGTLYGGPLVVLTSPLSASASEIVAGAIQDYGRGLIVGATATHGKGTVQRVIPLDQILAGNSGKNESPEAGTLKITTQKFYRISGGSTQTKGVESDIVLPSPLDGLGFSESDLDYPLPFDEINKARFRKIGDFDGLLPSLRATSEKRVYADEDFKQMADLLSERQSAMDKVEFSLNLDTRRQEFEERKQRLGLDDEDTDESTDEEPPDPVLDETLLILKDFIALSALE